MNVDPYAGEAGAALRNAETAMKGNVEFWESEAMRFVALSARIDGDI